LPFPNVEVKVKKSTQNKVSRSNQNKHHQTNRKENFGFSKVKFKK
jgi:hypothetical protein